MATSIRSVLQTVIYSNRVFLNSYSRILAHHNRSKASWTKFFKKDEQSQSQQWSSPVRQLGPEDGPSTVSRLESLKKKEGLVTIRGYSPPSDVAGRVSSAVKSILGKTWDSHMPLPNRSVKFQLLTRLMSEFDHYIPNTELNDLNTVDDITTFFSTPVKSGSSYEDLAKLDLPPNLHIQLEPIRFDAVTDTFFDGKNAFPDRPTIVSSLKYRKKYKGNQGESRYRHSLTRFEELKMYSRKT